MASGAGIGGAGGGFHPICPSLKRTWPRLSSARWRSFVAFVNGPASSLTSACAASIREDVHQFLNDAGYTEIYTDGEKTYTSADCPQGQMLYQATNPEGDAVCGWVCCSDDACENNDTGACRGFNFDFNPGVP